MNKEAPRKGKKVWTFLRMFRWTVYIFFASLMLFTAVCVAAGVISNLSEGFPKLTMLDKKYPQKSKITAHTMQDCRDSLGKMRQEDLHETTLVFEGKSSRDEFLRQYKTWSKDWRKRFEKLGIICGITSDLQSSDPIQQRLAIVYQKLDELHRNHSRLVRKYITENSLRLRQVRELMKQTKQPETSLRKDEHPSG